MAEGGGLNMSDARRMLSSGDFGSSSKAGESALYALDMVRSMRSSILAGRGPTPDSADWKVAKAAMEVMVRWGVYPLLSPGVGIPVERRFKNKAAVAGAAGAVLEHAQQQAPLPRVCDTLYDSAEFLVEVVLDLSPNAGALRDLVISDHLPDLWAACLQLCYGPVLVGGLSQAPVLQRRSGVSEMIDWLVEKLPVSHAVEAVLTLLAQDNSPPPWLKSEAGKVLSRLVMRDGGVVAVLERLVGNAPQGDVAVQRRVASHLARSPKYVAKAQDYYKRISPQVLHLLSLRTSAADRRQIGEAGVRVVRNMHHTSVIMVCIISQQEPQLMEAFLMEPLLEPLLKWASGKSGIVEKRLIDSLLQLHVLITAGHEGASVVKQMLVRKTKGIAPRLVLLHQLLEGGKTRKSASAKERGIKSNTGLEKGFLSSRDSHDDADADNIVNRVRDSVGDILLVHMMEPIDHSLSICCNYIFHCNSKYLEWPGGDIGAAIESHKGLSQSPALYISRLLLAIQNWELTVRVLNRLFYRILELRRNLVASGVDRNVEESKELQRLMQVWEQMLEVVGSKAFEQDTVAAVSFVKDLFNNKEVVDDPDLLELVFHMLHRLETGGGKKQKSEDWKPVLDSLTMICSSSHPERVKQMASTLQNSISENFQP